MSLGRKDIKAKNDAINEALANVHQAANDLYTDLEIRHEVDPGYETASTQIKSIITRAINDLTQLESKIYSSDDDDGDPTVSPLFTKAKSHKTLQDSLESIKTTLTTHDLTTSPKVTAFINSALENHDKIVDLHLPEPSPYGVIKLPADAVFYSEFKELIDTICKDLPANESAEYKKAFAEMIKRVQAYFESILIDFDKAVIEKYDEDLKANLKEALDRINKSTGLKHELLINEYRDKALTFLKEHEKNVIETIRHKKVIAGSITSVDRFGTLPAASSSSSAPKNPGTYSKIEFPLSLDELEKNLKKALKEEDTKNELNDFKINEVLKTLKDFSDNLPIEVTKAGVNLDDLKKQKNNHVKLLTERTKKVIDFKKAETNKALEAYLKHIDERFNGYTAKLIVAPPPPPPAPAKPALDKNEGAKLFIDYEEIIEQLKAQHLLIEANHPKAFTLFDPFDDGKAMRRRMEEHLRMLIDLPSSPKLKENLKDIKENSTISLKDELDHYKGTDEAKNRLRKFIETSAAAIEIMEKLSKFHTITNSTVSEIFTIPDGKDEKAFFEEKATALGINTSAAVAAEADLASGNASPVFTDKLTDNKMRVYAIKTCSETQIAVAETKKNGVLRAVVYDATTAYSVDKLMEMVCSANGVPKDSINAICNAIKNEYYKKMILKEGVIENILAMYVGEASEKIAQAFHKEHMIRNFQKYDGFDLPSDELTRFAIGLVNSMFAERPNEVININKAPSAAFVYAVTLVCKANGYPVNNDTKYKCVQPSQREIKAFTDMMHMHNVGAEKFGTAAVHLHTANKLRRHTM